jgi:hypothetical protein
LSGEAVEASVPLLARIHTTNLLYSISGCLGTREGAGLPLKSASMLSSASIPIAERVSTVALPICGNRNVSLSAIYPGLTFEDVQPRGCNSAALKCGDEILIHHQTTTSSVDDDCAVWQEVDCFRIDEMK